MRATSCTLDPFHLVVCFLVLASADAHFTKARYFGRSRHGASLTSDVPEHSKFTNGTHVGRFHYSLLQRGSLTDRMNNGGSQATADARLAEKVKNGLGKIIFGIVFFLIAFPIQWYNEERNARMKILLQRGLTECVSISPEEASENNHGRLVHVQGWAHAAFPLKDHRFQNVQVTNCLKLQSTMEVFEWIQTSRTLLDRKGAWKQPCFQTEWTTYHHNSQRFKKPSPENPKIPSGISLGVSTQVCPRIELGAFVLSKEMIDSFLKFEPAMKYLPQTLHANGFTFFANPQDGCYYSRPGVSSLEDSARFFKEHHVGDIRARFRCVRDCEATIVAVQCQKGLEGGGTFMPYRPISNTPYFADCQMREKRIEEGVKPLMDPRGVSCTCTCCACQSEKVTEEIFYTSDRLDPREYPFEKLFPSNLGRLWTFRLIGWALMYIGIAMILGPFAGAIQHAQGFTAYGSVVVFILPAIVTLAMAMCIMALAYACYQPIMVLKWFLAFVLIIVMRLMWMAGLKA